MPIDWHAGRQPLALLGMPVPLAPTSRGMAPIICPRCGELRETYTVPLRLPGGTRYQSLCAECFPVVTGEQPTPEQAIRQVKSLRGGRR